MNGKPQASNDSERSFDVHKTFNERKPHRKIKRYFSGILVIVQYVVLPKLVVTTVRRFKNGTPFFALFVCEMLIKFDRKRHPYSYCYNYSAVVV